jgi:protein TIF31
MNPNEPARAHVYLHNNIFFSRAVDAGLDTFKIIQGDRAAKKTANREAQNVGVIHRLDIRGLYTLGTVLIEYLGTRFVCQTVVPGILHGDKAHTLSYGAVEALSELQCDAEMHKVLEDGIGEECMVATRGILSRPLSEERVEDIKQFKSTLPLPIINASKEASEGKDDGTVKVNNVCGPVEMKGIIGSDKRKYVLDCTRLTPRDANWVSKSKGGTGHWEEASSSGGLIPIDLDDDEWTASVLRPELVTSYADEKLKQFLRARQAKEAENKSADAAIADEDDDVKKEESADEANGKDKDWVDVKKATDGNAEADASTMQKEEDEFIQTLRYNVNVFLPYMKSIESVDKYAYDQLMKDEEEARKLASFLWDTVLPEVTKKLRLDNSKTFQIPIDGKSLTEFLHKHGINCRYLGRLADLARIEEQKDIDAEKAYENNKKANKLPRFRMPLCWLELLELEMVARAAKHVLDSYLIRDGGTAAVQPAQTIASLLSAVVSVGEETASETELRTAVTGGDSVGAEEINALTLFDVGGNGDAVHIPVRGRSEIWSDIVKEVGRRFRYTLSLYNTDKANNRALYTPLLRRICQRSGIRIVAKSYAVGKKCVCGGSSNSNGRLDYSYPIAAVDIIDVVPLVKHAASSGEDAFAPCRFDGNNTSTLHIVLADAKVINDAALRCFNTGNIEMAADYAQEAVSLYQRVIDSPIHVQIAKCIHLLSKCHFYGQDHEALIMSSLKYLAVSVSLGGFDCMEALTAHSQLSDAYFAAGKAKEGIKHIRALQFLMEFLAGGNYSQLSAIYYKIGTQYFEGEKLLDALRFYEVAQKRRADDRMVHGIVASSAAIAQAHLHKFSEACSEEKIAYQLYQALLGDDHDRTKISSASLLVSSWLCS